MGFLLDNIVQQITTMRSMNKQPTKFICDTASFDALLDELPTLPTITDPSKPTKIYGLDVEISSVPNFEVV